MVGNQTYPRNFFKANEILHRFAGLWIFDREKSSRKWKIAQHTYSILVYGITLCLIITELIMFKETVKEIAKFIAHFEIMLSNVSAFAKIATLRIQHRKLEKIIKTLQDERYYYKPVGLFKPDKIFLEGQRGSRLVSTLLFGFYSLVGIMAYISSKASMEYNVKQNYFAPNESCYDFLAYTFYIPFSCESKRRCEVAIIFMGVSLMTCGWILASHDALYVALVNCLESHFKVLGQAIRTIRKRVMTRLNLQENFQIFHDDELPRLENALYQELRHSVKHLVTLLEVAEELEAIFNLVLLLQVIISLISFASVLFVTTTVPVGSPEFFTQFEYFIALLMQLGVFCWFGERINTTSQDILPALYECDWFSSSRRFKSTLVLTMCRMQRPLTLTFGKFCHISLNSLVAVVKSSISYYTVFKTVNE